MAARDKPQPPIRLELTTTSVRNCVISTGTDAHYFEALTQRWIPNITQVKKLDQVTGEMVIIAEIERVKGREPCIKFAGEKQFKPAADFVSSDNPFAVQGKFKAEDGRYYKWQVKRRRLELIANEIVEGQKPKLLAVYHKHKRYFFCGLMSRHPCLEVQAELKPCLDTVLVSFLLMERLRRDSKQKLRH